MRFKWEDAKTGNYNNQILWSGDVGCCCEVCGRQTWLEPTINE